MSRVVLQKTLADRLNSNDHVIVTKNNMDGDNVAWSDVDTTSLTDNPKKVPCSKLVHQLSGQTVSISSSTGELSADLSDVTLSVEALSGALITLTGDTSGSLTELSNNVIYLSTGLSALYNHKAVHFIGMSETDPTTGIVTIDGITYRVSSDFNESNDGNIVYYKTTIPNHDHADNPGVDGDGPITVMYAYIYANGTWSDSLAVKVNDDESGDGEDDSKPEGKFYRFGYSFYDNLSTLIHDDMVCDHADIKMTKISGLCAEFVKNYGEHKDLSDLISGLSDSLSDYQLAASAVMSANKLTSDIDQLSGSLKQLSDSLSSYVLTSNVCYSFGTDDKLIPNVHAVSSAISNVVSTQDTINTSVATSANNLNRDIAQLKDDVAKLNRSILSIFNILSTTLRPETGSIVSGDDGQTYVINGYTW